MSRLAMGLLGSSSPSPSFTFPVFLSNLVPSSPILFTDLLPFNRFK
jgi:hypothetical protein